MLPQRSDEAGAVLFFYGRVISPDGAPVAGAELDMWQADAQGFYSNIHPTIPDWNLRGRFCSADNGVFEVRTIIPPAYEIAKDGPTGIVLRTLGRHFFRPAHLHVKVSHPQYRSLTSQLYFDGGDYLDSDVANAVREHLVAKLVRRDHPDDLATEGCTSLILKFTMTSFWCLQVPAPSNQLKSTFLNELNELFRSSQDGKEYAKRENAKC